MIQLTETNAQVTNILGMPDRRQSTAIANEPHIPTPHYDRIKTLPNRAERVLAALGEILSLMENPAVVWQLKGKLARSGFQLMPENENTPPEMSAKLAYTELEVLRLRLTNLVLYPPAATAANRDPMNNLSFSAEDDLDILHAIRREAANHLRTSSDDMVFHELKNLCQLSLGNLQQMTMMHQHRRLS